MNLRTVLLCTLILSLPTAAVAARPSLLDAIVERGSLRCAVLPGYIPFTADGGAAEELQRRVVGGPLEAVDGVVGFDVELARALAASLGVRLELRRASDLEGLLALVSSGEADLALSGLTRTLERARRFNLSVPYFVSGLVLLVPEDSPWRTLDELNRPDVSVLVKPGATSARFVARRLPRAKAVPVSDEKSFGKTLSAGKHVAVMDAVKALSFRLSGLLKGRWRRLEGRRFTDEYFGAVLPRDEALTRYVDLFLEESKRTGRFHELASRFNAWFRSDAP